MAEADADHVAEADGFRLNGLGAPDVLNTTLSSVVTSVMTSFMTSLDTYVRPVPAVELIPTSGSSTVSASPERRADKEDILVRSFDVAEGDEGWKTNLSGVSPPIINEGDWTTQLFDGNLTVVDEGMPDAGSASTVGVAVGVTVMCIIIAAVIVLIVFIVLRRKRQKQREKSIVRIENPRYHDSLAARSQGTVERGLSLSTAPTVNFQANNNPMVTFESNNGSSRRKGDGPPIYRLSKPDTSTPIKTVKKPPPPPPHTTVLQGSKDSVRVPLNCDIYEKDSAHGSMDNVEQTYNLLSVDNPHSPLSPHSPSVPQPSPSINSHSLDASRPSSVMKSPVLNDTNASSQPLLDISYRPPPPKPPRKSDGSSTASSSVASSRKVLSPPPLAQREGSDEDEGVEEDPESGGRSSSMRTALLGEKAKIKNDKTMSSNMSLDSYDRTFNPFFADT